MASAFQRMSEVLSFGELLRSSAGLQQTRELT
jgi:hypothetical protein